MKEGERNKIVFVCTGNICRSPIAEALFKHAVAALPADSPLRKFEICSAGTSATNGMPPSDNSVDVLKRVGIDISDYRSALLTQKTVSESFAIFAMEDWHEDTIRSRFKNVPERLHRILDFSNYSGDGNVPDPYGGDIGEYLEVRDDIASSIGDILNYLKNETSKI